MMVSNQRTIILANTTFAPTVGAANYFGSRTHQLELKALGVGAYRQSTKFAFNAVRSNRWIVDAAIEPKGAPTAGGAVNIWIGYSNSATAAEDNKANLTGADAAYVGYGAAAADATEAVKLLDYVGSIMSTADDAIFTGEVGIIEPKLPYGIIVVQNNLNVSLEDGDSIEMCVRIRELSPAR